MLKINISSKLLIFVKGDDGDADASGLITREGLQLSGQGVKPWHRQSPLCKLFESFFQTKWSINVMSRYWTTICSLNNFLQGVMPSNFSKSTDRKLVCMHKSQNFIRTVTYVYVTVTEMLFFISQIFYELSDMPFN